MRRWNLILLVALSLTPGLAAQLGRNDPYPKLIAPLEKRMDAQGQVLVEIRDLLKESVIQAREQQEGRVRLEAQLGLERMRAEMVDRAAESEALRIQMVRMNQHMEELRALSDALQQETDRLREEVRVRALRQEELEREVGVLRDKQAKKETPAEGPPPKPTAEPTPKTGPPGPAKEGEAKKAGTAPGK